MAVAMVLVIVAVLAWLWCVARRRLLLGRLGAPPAPDGGSPLGHLLPLVTRAASAHALIRQLYESTRGLPCAAVFAGPYTTVLLLRDTELVRHVTVRAFASFCDHHAVSGDPLLAGSLMFLRGESWRRMRSILSPAFTSGKIKDVMELMSQVSRNMVDHIENVMKTRELADGPVPMEIEDLMNRYSSDVIASTAFGHDCNSFADRNNEFYRRGKDITDFSGMRALVLIGHVLFPSLMKALGIPFVRASSRDFLLRLVRDAVEARRRAPGCSRPDVLQLLMAARHEDGTGTLASTIA